MRPISLSGRLLLLALALEVLLAVVALAASQRTPGIASTVSAFPTPSAPVSPTPSGPLPDVTAPASATPREETPNGFASPTPTSERPGWLTLGEMLALLPTAAENRTGYERDLFPHWIDADGDGCNTRKEVLIQEATLAPAVDASCSLSGGTWHSLYDGLVLTDASELQIDHLVALAEAWDSGASAWSTPRRELFANDLDVIWTLIAVSGASNHGKSDKDPADWVPSETDAVCPFVSAWIAVKARWTLSVDQREQSALAGLILECPDSRMPFVPAPTADPTPIPAPSGACSPAYPAVCIPAPPPDLDCADIPYRRFSVLAPDPHRFDGDSDGIGCEG